MPDTPATAASEHWVELSDKSQKRQQPTAAASRKPTWRAIFSFTTPCHIPTLLGGALLSIISGGLKPIVAIFLGKVLNAISAFIRGDSTKDQLMAEVGKWCLVITGMGVGIWLINGGFFILWLLFGEKQAKEVRERMFSALLRKKMSWYDLREDGISALLIRIQT
jgi:ATP-binding cassette subfamily B (MDR/TAP) protein 1